MSARDKSTLASYICALYSRHVPKDASIQIRLTAAQKRALRAAAIRAGAPLSTWVLMAALKAAQP